MAFVNYECKNIIFMFGTRLWIVVLDVLWEAWIFAALRLKNENWKLKIENWKLKIENWKLKIENWKLKIFISDILLLVILELVTSISNFRLSKMKHITLFVKTKI